MPSTHTTTHEQKAYELGVEHATNAASWTIEGTTKREAIPAVLAMLDDGDPRADDYLPRRPDLSGEWADGLTPASLAREVGLDADAFGASDDASAEIDAACDAYEAGVTATFEPECERILRAAVAS